MKVYTRAGDQGGTHLIGARGVSKADPRIEAIGAVDELNSAIGLAASVAGGHLSEQLRQVQCWLFDFGVELGSEAPKASLPLPNLSERVETLEAWIDAMDQRLEPLSNFILPGGTELSSRLHLARAVCRRAERRVVALGQTSSVRGESVAFLNRLSDWLFTAARCANREAGVADAIWKPQKEAKTC